MAYLVNINARAERDLAALYDAIDAESFVAARRWYTGLNQAILDLEDQPYLWPVTREGNGCGTFFTAASPTVSIV